MRFPERCTGVDFGDGDAVSVRTIIAIVASVALGSCSLEDGSICTGYASLDERDQTGRLAMAPDTSPSVRVFASIAVAEFCVKQTARRFAVTKDGADVVAQAVVAHCNDAIGRVVGAQLDADRASGNNSPVWSSTTGRASTVQEMIFDRMHRSALAATVEARAGRCKPLR